MFRAFSRLAIVLSVLAAPALAGAQQTAGETVQPARAAVPSFRPPPGGELREPRAMERERPMRPQHSMSEAVRRVQRRTGGQILGAERVPFEGRDITRIKYMDDRGRVRYMDDPGPARSAPRRGDHDAQ